MGESYVDEEGVIRKAVSYGRTDLQLEVWYRCGDIQQYFPNWEIHKPSLFYNGKKWRDETPFFLNKSKKAMNVEKNQKKPKVTNTQEGASGYRTTPTDTAQQSRNNQPHRDQSSRDIQGGNQQRRNSPRDQSSRDIQGGNQQRENSPMDYQGYSQQ